MTVRRVELESTSVEKIRVGLISRNDPTGALPSFQITVETVADPSAWANGSWDGTWNPETGYVVALSPVTSTANFALTANTEMKGWIKWTHGAETPVKLFALIVVK
jgi:hypothetical protein